MGSKCCKCNESDKIYSDVSRQGQLFHSQNCSYYKKRDLGVVVEPLRPVGSNSLNSSYNNSNYNKKFKMGPEVPEFLSELSDLAVKVGTKTKFSVEIRSLSTLKVSWYQNENKINFASQYCTIVNEGNLYSVEVSLILPEMDGRWTCVAENLAGRSVCSCYVKVLIPKTYQSPEFVQSLRALLTEAGSVSLECKVIGVPSPSLKWFKDNLEIKAGDVFALTASASDPTSLGTYTCEATNCMGRAISSSKVHIQNKNIPIVIQELLDHKARVGEIHILSVTIIPPFPVKIEWYNKGSLVLNTDSKIQSFSKEDGIASICLSPLGIEDEGEWKILLYNESGLSSVSSCNLSIIIPKNYRKPKFIENLKAILTEEGLVSFECKVVGFPTPQLFWFKDGHELKPGDVYQLSGTNSLGLYSCVAKNCMGSSESNAELTYEDIKHQLGDEENKELINKKVQPPRFSKGLKSIEGKLSEKLRLSVESTEEIRTTWYRDNDIVLESDKYEMISEPVGKYHLEIKKLELEDEAEWKCLGINEYGHIMTSCRVTVVIPAHYRKPKFLEPLRAALSNEGTVNLECKVIGVPQPELKWYKDGLELKAGDIHKIISGEGGTCCLGTYTCSAFNCMGSVSSSASLLGFEDKEKKHGEKCEIDPLSTIAEERSSQLNNSIYETPNSDHSISLSLDGKEVSLSLYETPDLTENDAVQILEMFAHQCSENISEQNVVTLPSLRIMREMSTSGRIKMEAVIIDVTNFEPHSPENIFTNDDRTENDIDDISEFMDILKRPLLVQENDELFDLGSISDENDSFELAELRDSSLLTPVAFFKEDYKIQKQIEESCDDKSSDIHDQFLNQVEEVSFLGNNFDEAVKIDYGTDSQKSYELFPLERQLIHDFEIVNSLKSENIFEYENVFSNLLENTSEVQKSQVNELSTFGDTSSENLFIEFNPNKPYMNSFSNNLEQIDDLSFNESTIGAGGLTVEERQAQIHQLHDQLYNLEFQNNNSDNYITQVDVTASELLKFMDTIKTEGVETLTEIESLHTYGAENEKLFSETVSLKDEPLCALFSHSEERETVIEGPISESILGEFNTATVLERENLEEILHNNSKTLDNKDDFNETCREIKASPLNTQDNLENPNNLSYTEEAVILNEVISNKEEVKIGNETKSEEEEMLKVKLMKEAKEYDDNSIMYETLTLATPITDQLKAIEKINLSSLEESSSSQIKTDFKNITQLKENQLEFPKEDYKSDDQFCNFSDESKSGIRALDEALSSPEFLKTETIEELNSSAELFKQNFIKKTSNQNDKLLNETVSNDVTMQIADENCMDNIVNEISTYEAENLKIEEAINESVVEYAQLINQEIGTCSNIDSNNLNKSHPNDNNVKNNVLNTVPQNEEDEKLSLISDKINDAKGETNSDIRPKISYEENNALTSKNLNTNENCVSDLNSLSNVMQAELNLYKNAPKCDVVEISNDCKNENPSDIELIGNCKNENQLEIEPIIRNENLSNSTQDLDNDSCKNQNQLDIELIATYKNLATPTQDLDNDNCKNQNQSDIESIIKNKNISPATQDFDNDSCKNEIQPDIESIIIGKNLPIASQDFDNELNKVKETIIIENLLLIGPQHENIDPILEKNLGSCDISLVDEAKIGEEINLCNVSSELDLTKNLCYSSESGISARNESVINTCDMSKIKDNFIDDKNCFGFSDAAAPIEIENIEILNEKINDTSSHEGEKLNKVMISTEKSYYDNLIEKEPKLNEENQFEIGPLETQKVKNCTEMPVISKNIDDIKENVQHNFKQINTIENILNEINEENEKLNIQREEQKVETLSNLDGNIKLNQKIFEITDNALLSQTEVSKEPLKQQFAQLGDQNNEDRLLSNEINETISSSFIDAEKEIEIMLEKTQNQDQNISIINSENIESNDFNDNVKNKGVLKILLAQNLRETVIDDDDDNLNANNTDLVEFITTRIEEPDLDEEMERILNKSFVQMSKIESAANKLANDSAIMSKKDEQSKQDDKISISITNDTELDKRGINIDKNPSIAIENDKINEQNMCMIDKDLITSKKIEENKLLDLDSRESVKGKNNHLEEQDLDKKGNFEDKNLRHEIEIQKHRNVNENVDVEDLKKSSNCLNENILKEKGPEDEFVIERIDKANNDKIQGNQINKNDEFEVNLSYVENETNVQLNVIDKLKNYSPETVETLAIEVKNELQCNFVTKNKAPLVNLNANKNEGKVVEIKEDSNATKDFQVQNSEDGAFDISKNRVEKLSESKKEIHCDLSDKNDADSDLTEISTINDPMLSPKTKIEESNEKRDTQENANEKQDIKNCKVNIEIIRDENITEHSTDKADDRFENLTNKNLTKQVVESEDFSHKPKEVTKEKVIEKQNIKNTKLSVEKSKDENVPEHNTKEEVDDGLNSETSKNLIKKVVELEDFSQKLNETKTTKTEEKEVTKEKAIEKQYIESTNVDTGILNDKNVSELKTKDRDDEGCENVINENLIKKVFESDGFSHKPDYNETKNEKSHDKEVTQESSSEKQDIKNTKSSIAKSKDESASGQNADTKIDDGLENVRNQNLIKKVLESDGFSHKPDYNETKNEKSHDKEVTQESSLEKQDIKNTKSSIAKSKDESAAGQNADARVDDEFENVRNKNLIKKVADLEDFSNEPDYNEISAEKSDEKLVPSIEKDIEKQDIISTKVNIEKLKDKNVSEQNVKDTDDGIENLGDKNLLKSKVVASKDFSHKPDYSETKNEKSDENGVTNENDLKKQGVKSTKVNMLKSEDENASEEHSTKDKVTSEHQNLLNKNLLKTVVVSEDFPHKPDYNETKNEKTDEKEVTNENDTGKQEVENTKVNMLKFKNKNEREQNIKDEVESDNAINIDNKNMVEKAVESEDLSQKPDYNKTDNKKSDEKGVTKKIETEKQDIKITKVKKKHIKTMQNNDEKIPEITSALEKEEKIAETRVDGSKIEQSLKKEENKDIDANKTDSKHNEISEKKLDSTNQVKEKENAKSTEVDKTHQLIEKEGENQGSRVVNENITIKQNINQQLEKDDILDKQTKEDAQIDNSKNTNKDPVKINLGLKSDHVPKENSETSEQITNEKKSDDVKIEIITKDLIKNDIQMPVANTLITKEDETEHSLTDKNAIDGQLKNKLDIQQKKGKEKALGQPDKIKKNSTQQSLNNNKIDEQQKNSISKDEKEKAKKMDGNSKKSINEKEVVENTKKIEIENSNSKDQVNTDEKPCIDSVTAKKQDKNIHYKDTTEEQSNTTPKEMTENKTLTKVVQIDHDKGQVSELKYTQEQNEKMKNNNREHKINLAEFQQANQENIPQEKLFNEKQIEKLNVIVEKDGKNKVRENKNNIKDSIQILDQSKISLNQQAKDESVKSTRESLEKVQNCNKLELEIGLNNKIKFDKDRITNEINENNILNKTDKKNEFSIDLQKVQEHFSDETLGKTTSGFDNNDILFKNNNLKSGNNAQPELASNLKLRTDSTPEKYSADNSVLKNSSSLIHDKNEELFCLRDSTSQSSRKFYDSKPNLSLSHENLSIERHLAQDIDKYTRNKHYLSQPNLSKGRFRSNQSTFSSTPFSTPSNVEKAIKTPFSSKFSSLYENDFTDINSPSFQKITRDRFEIKDDIHIDDYKNSSYEIYSKSRPQNLDQKRHIAKMRNLNKRAVSLNQGFGLYEPGKIASDWSKDKDTLISKENSQIQFRLDSFETEKDNYNKRHEDSLKKYENKMAKKEAIISEFKEMNEKSLIDNISVRSELTMPKFLQSSDYSYFTDEVSSLRDPTKRPRFSLKLQDRVVSTGSNVKITCTVLGNPVPKLQFYKNGHPINSDGFKINISSSSGVASLNIKNATKEDMAEYTCFARNMHGKAATSCILTVVGDQEKRAQPAKITREISQCQFNDIGELMLECSVGGYPPPVVQWVKDGQIIIPFGSHIVGRYSSTLSVDGRCKLFIHDIKESDSGQYTCIAKNESWSDEASLTVKVLEKPVRPQRQSKRDLQSYDSAKIEQRTESRASTPVYESKPPFFILTPESSILICEGDDLILTCEVGGDPKPRVNLYRGCRDVSLQSRGFRETVGDSVRFILRRVEIMDAGRMTIEAKNLYGIQRFSLTLKVEQREKRARSMTPALLRPPSLSSLSNLTDSRRRHFSSGVPGKLTEPIASELGPSWVSLRWTRPESSAPILAYKIEAWDTSEGARWITLGMSSIPSFEAFHLRPGREYLFRVTPRNRFGWGESVSTNSPVSVRDKCEMPDFTKVLPLKVKALRNSIITLSCEVRGSPVPELKWLKNGKELSSGSPSVEVEVESEFQLSVVASNSMGEAVSFCSVVPVDDALLAEADELLRREDGGAAPQFLMRLRDRRVQLLHPLRLTCQVGGTGKINVHWEKDEVELQSTSSNIFTFQDNNFYTLELNHVKLEDAGTYKVRVRSEFGEISCSSTVTVTTGYSVHPRWVKSLRDYVKVAEGATVVIEGHVQAWPSVSVKWFKDSNRLRCHNRRFRYELDHHGHISLVIQESCMKDTGIYSAVVQNELGTIESFCCVEVIGNEENELMSQASCSKICPKEEIPSAPRFLRKPMSMTVVEGDTVVIECSLEGFPKPEVLWLRDWLNPSYYKDSEHYELECDGDKEYRLVIPCVKIDYTGSYTVMARNSLGSCKAIVSLQVGARLDEGKSKIQVGPTFTVPKIVQELRDLRCCEGDSVTLVFKALGEELIYIWEKDGKVISSTSKDFLIDGPSLTIHRIYGEDEGVYKCKVSNALGCCETKACLLVDYPINEPSISLLPSDEIAGAVSSSIKSCREREEGSKGFRFETSNLSSYSPPKFLVLPHNRICNEGDNVRFHCSVFGATVTTWTKDDKVIGPSLKINRREEDDVRVLEIINVTQSDAGIYQITLENHNGRTTANMRLDVVGRSCGGERMRAWSSSPVQDVRTDLWEP